MAVEPARHRRGTGTAMLAETERALVAAVADGNDAN
jgi:hypothetical protein